MPNRAERRAAARAPQSRRASRGGRVALLPSVLAASAVLAGLGLESSGGYVVIRFIVTILTAISAVFALQARAWWWLPPLAAIVVIWNPVLQLSIPDPAWGIVQVIAVATLIAAGATIRRAG